jgi:hypothetical protein
LLVRGLVLLYSYQGSETEVQMYQLLSVVCAARVKLVT